MLYSIGDGTLPTDAFQCERVYTSSINFIFCIGEGSWLALLKCLPKTILGMPGCV